MTLDKAAFLILVIASGCGDGERTSDSRDLTSSPNQANIGPGQQASQEGLVSIPLKCARGAIEQIVFGVRPKEGQEEHVAKNGVDFTILARRPANVTTGRPMSYRYPTNDESRYPILTTEDRRYAVNKEIADVNHDLFLKCWNGICNKSNWKTRQHGLQEIGEGTVLYTETPSDSGDVTSIEIIVGNDKVEFSEINGQPMIYSRCVRSTEVGNSRFSFWNQDQEGSYQPPVDPNEPAGIRWLQEQKDLVPKHTNRLKEYHTVFQSPASISGEDSTQEDAEDRFYEFRKTVLSLRPFRVVEFTDLSANNSRASCEGFSHANLQLSYGKLAYDSMTFGEVSVFGGYHPTYNDTVSGRPSTSFPANYANVQEERFSVNRRTLSAAVPLSLPLDRHIVSVLLKNHKGIEPSMADILESPLDHIYLNCFSNWHAAQY